MALHTNLPAGDIHVPWNWSYADSAVREAATGFVLTDEGKFCRQESDNTIWMLIDYENGDWVEVGNSSGGELTIEAHKALRQLIHFINDGPAEGFASGAYKEITGTVFPTSIIWYNESGTSKKKIVEKLITWTGVVPTEITWNIYDSSEVITATVVDTISYSTVFETSRTRTIS
jgi:hypothetical protein